ncbi:MAG: lipopolysaccharide heptosyltransferase family protein [Cyanobacteriota bacterium]|nr:lipopolysaccharide heptosyltransferase family protein [Cyanobacteriota bacterium]
MRALFLSPGTAARQLQLFPAVAALTEQLGAQVQICCPPSSAGVWQLHATVEKTIPFPFGAATLADWTNLLGTVREPDFQVVINLARSTQLDLMLSMSHIPRRVALGGFSATDTVVLPPGWPAQAMEVLLRPIGVTLDADTYRLSLPAAELENAARSLPEGSGPLLALQPSAAADDWPASRWSELPARIRSRLPDLRVLETRGPFNPGSLRQQVARLACADVVLTSDPLMVELALLLGLPLVALGPSTALPERPGVQGVGRSGSLAGIGCDAVLAALGFS